MQSGATQSAASLRAFRGYGALGLWSGAIALVWLVGLPWWAQRDTMRERIEWLHARQVDPSAMYYTELEAMKPILRELNRRQAGHGYEPTGRPTRR